MLCGYAVTQCLRNERVWHLFCVPEERSLRADGGTDGLRVRHAVRDAFGDVEKNGGGRLVSSRVMIRCANVRSPRDVASLARNAMRVVTAILL